MERHPLAHEIVQQLQLHGFQGRIVSVRHLGDLQEELETHHRLGHFDEEFYRERLTWFRFSPPEELPGAQSLIVAALPRPQTQAVFRQNGKRVPLIIPPTFSASERTRQHLLGLLTDLLSPVGYRAALGRLPLKMLAVHSGLGAYGRNNICYIPGMGSFLQLVALFSDLPCPEDTWWPLRTMKRCEKCTACQRRCPAGAITAERFLLHAERCIVFHNERPGDVPFPAWIDPSWHHCLVGCMQCQAACPENRRFMRWVEDSEEFSGEETALLLRGVALDQLLPGTVEKLARLEMTDALDILPRNVGVLMRNSPLPETRGERR